MDAFCMRRRRAEKAASLIGDEPELTHCRKAYPAMRLTKMMVRVSSSRSMAGQGKNVAARILALYRTRREKKPADICPG